MITCVAMLPDGRDDGRQHEVGPGTLEDISLWVQTQELYEKLSALESTFTPAECKAIALAIDAYLFAEADDDWDLNPAGKQSYSNFAAFVVQCGKAGGMRMRRDK